MAEINPRKQLGTTTIQSSGSKCCWVRQKFEEKLKKKKNGGSMEVLDESINASIIAQFMV